MCHKTCTFQYGFFFFVIIQTINILKFYHIKYVGTILLPF